MSVLPPKKIRVLFVNCPRLDTSACSYLILAQNKIQSLLEFSVHHYWVFAHHALGNSAPWGIYEWLSETSLVPNRVRRWAYGKHSARLDLAKAPEWKAELGEDTWFEKASKLVNEHDAWWANLTSGYGGRDGRDVATIIVTETPIYGAYYADAENNLAIVTLANWKVFAPPSALEFVLSRIQRYALRIAFPSHLGSHYSTKGCVWDFDASIRDVHAGILTGFICEQCRNDLAAVLDEQAFKNIATLIDYQWIGRIEDAGSVASNLKRVYGFDLARTRGLSGGVLSDLIAAGAKEVVGNVAKIGVYVLWVAFLLWLVTHHWISADTLKSIVGK